MEKEYIDEQINRLMDNIYHKLNKKLDALLNQPNTRHNNGNAPKFQPRLINLTNIKLKKRTGSNTIPRPKLRNRARTQTIHQQTNNRHRKCYKILRT